MSEINDKTPDSPEELARKRKILEEINAHTAKNINSWADLYEALKAQALMFFSNPNPATAQFTVALLLMFVVALEEAPEEGDARRIAEAMNELLVFGGDKTGVTVSFSSTPAESPVSPDTILEALTRAAVLLAVENEALQEPTTTPKAKRTLH